MALAREHAEALDAADPLRGFRERFVTGDPGRLYLDGNSLGRLPVAVRDRLAAVIDEWGDQLVAGWHDWIDAPQRAGDAIAPLIGAAPGEVIVCDSVTVNLFKLAGAILDARRLSPGRTLVTDRGNFPTDRYVLEGIARAHELELRLFEAADPVLGVQPDDLAAAVEPGDVHVVVLCAVDYRSGAIADMAALEEVARRHDANVIWDLSHAAGSIEVDLHGAGAELAVGCTYKYLNAGPGAAGYLYASERIAAELSSPIQGWFGQRDQFEMDRDYEPAEGVSRFLAGTPPILVLAAVEEGARLTAEAGMRALREKSVAQTALMVELFDERLAPLGFELGSPRDPARRGSHIALRHAQAWPICRAMMARNVIPDFRGPDVIRLATAPLYTRYVDLWDAFERIHDLVAAGEHTTVDAARARVT